MVLGRISITKYSRIKMLIIICGIMVNVGLSFIMHRFNVPLYLDTIGTIAAAALGGVFPGIITAVVSNTICGLFNGAAVYFSILNALIAILTAWFVHGKKLKKAGMAALFILAAGFIGGGLGALVQLLLFGEPQIAAINETVNSIVEATGINRVLCFMTVNTGLNIVDKGITTGAALLLVHLVNDDVKKQLIDSDWRQKPLKSSEIKKILKKTDGNSRSLQTRMTWMLAFTAVLLTFSVGIISIRLYILNSEKDLTRSAENTAAFAARIVDGDHIGDYLRGGVESQGYMETLDILKDLHESVSGLQYLYVYQIREDGCHVVFDTDPDVDPATDINSVLPFEDAFMEYVPDLLDGKRIDPIESKGSFGWLLTVYEPIYDSRGKCTAYVGADVSMVYFSNFVRDYIFKAALIFSGFFLAILAYGLWVSRMYLVYPINTMAAKTEDFLGDDNQEKLDEHVKNISAIDIRTEDEIENLYHAICSMTSNTARQIKEIKHYNAAVTQMQRGLIITMADLVENRDSDTGAHVQKTSAYVRIIMEGLLKKGYYTDKLTQKYMSDVEMSAPLHDIGKINIPDNVLNKPGKLTDEEYRIMKTHTTAGKMIMEKAISTVQGESYLKEARNMAAYHHEKWDGTGYPEGLKGEVIPLSARVMAVADVFDALVSKRVYKPAMPLEDALAILKKDAGTHFDPKCIEVFLENLGDVKRVMKKYQDGQTE